PSISEFRSLEQLDLVGKCSNSVRQSPPLSKTTTHTTYLNILNDSVLQDRPTITIHHENITTVHTTYLNLFYDLGFYNLGLSPPLSKTTTHTTYLNLQNDLVLQDRQTITIHHEN
ncbi:13072_t:CDS:2, partial [Racocetra persica]